jgi:hypothetical protein
VALWCTTPYETLPSAAEIPVNPREPTTVIDAGTFGRQSLRRLAVGPIELLDRGSERRWHEVATAMEHDARQPHPGVADQRPAVAE